MNSIYLPLIVATILLILLSKLVPFGYSFKKDKIVNEVIETGQVIPSDNRVYIRNGEYEISISSRLV